MRRPADVISLGSHDEVPAPRGPRESLSRACGALAEASTPVDDGASKRDVETKTVGIRRPAIVVTASVLAVALMTAEPVPLPRVAPESVGLDPARLKEATTLLNQFVADRLIAGAIGAVAQSGKVAYLETVGFQDLESRVPMTERSLFRIYSMSKAVTAVSAMILHEEGKFELNDPVSKYVPEFDTVKVLGEPGGTSRRPSRSLTVADLLLHTSGLNHRTSELYRTAKVRSRSMTLPQFVANIVRAPLMEEPGTRFRYSEGTTVVGRLIEIWAGAWRTSTSSSIHPPYPTVRTRVSMDGTAPLARSSGSTRRPSWSPCS